MTLYKVLARVWVTENKRVERKEVGSFESYICAKLFSEAYNEYYQTDSEIIPYEREVNFKG